MIKIIFPVMSILLLAGCGSDSDDVATEAVDEATTVSSVTFNAIQDHIIGLRERHVHNGSETSVVFCKDNAVASGDSKSGTYTIDGSIVTMDFTTETETLAEEDSDMTFKHDEHVQFNSTDYIITSIHSNPANSTICN